MPNTLQDTVNWAQTFEGISYAPLNAGVDNEPAISTANMILSTMTNAPLTWATNRSIYTFSTTQGTQDYLQPIDGFGFLEKVSLTDTNGNKVEIKDIYNNAALGFASQQGRPNAIAVQKIDESTGFVELGSDNFTRANQNPLSQGGNWALMQTLDPPSSPEPTPPLQVFSNVCEATNPGETNAMIYLGVTLPGDQYVKFTLGAFTGGSSVKIFARNTGANWNYGYKLFINPSAGQMQLSSGARGALNVSASITCATGDIYMLACVGSTLTCYQNGNVILTANDSTYVGGFGALEVDCADTPTDTTVTYFEVGTLGGVTFRFMSVPDAVYTVTLTYQNAPVEITALTDEWSGFPDSFSDIYNNLFLAEMYDVVDDARAQQRRMRGVAALLSKAQGLTDMQRSQILAQWDSRSLQSLSAQIRTQQGNQARGT